MGLRVITPPAAAVVTVAEAKARLRVDADGEDDDILAMIQEAQALAESHCQRRFVTQTLEWTPRRLFGCLPLAPVDAGSIVIRYVPDGSDTAVLLPRDSYAVRQTGAETIIRPTRAFSMPLLNPDADAPLRIEFVVGDAPEDVPRTVKAAVLTIVCDRYLMRESAVVGTVSSELAVFGSVARLLCDQVWLP